MDDNIANFSDVFNKLKQEIKECCDDELSEGGYGEDEDDDLDSIEIMEDMETDDVLAALTIDTPDTSQYPSTSAMRQDEKEIIDSCDDPELKSLLIMNRTKRLLLLELLDHVSKFKTEFKEIVSQIRENEKRKEKVRKTALSVWRVGYPYFKDRDCFPAPRNDDVIRKSINQELMVYQLNKINGWLTVEQTRLVRAVEINYTINMEMELNKNIESESDERTKKMLMNRLAEIQRNQEYPPLWCDKHIDWCKISENFLSKKHSEAECRSYWNLLLHPIINKSKWTVEENETLVNLVEKYNYQDWEKITLELGNNRSPLLTCMHFIKTYCQQFKAGNFTYKEDKKLVKLVKKYKRGDFIPWVEISKHFDNRSRSQIYHRYVRYLEKTPQRGRFTDAEDILLMVLVDRFGRKYTKCVEYFPTRNSSQLKSRYTMNLKQCIKKGHWTKEEDDKIMRHVKQHGAKNYTAIATTLGRTAPQVRQRFATIVEFLRKNPGKTFTEASNNKRKRDYPDKFKLLRSIADTFKESSTIPTLQDIQEVLNIYEPATKKCRGDAEEVLSIELPPSTEDRTYKKIDDLLLDFFTFNNFEGPTRPKTNDISKAVDHLERLLSDLKVNLKIPDDLDENLHLDTVDKELLTILKTRKKPKNVACNEICRAIPPNFRTVRGLNLFLTFESGLVQFATPLTVRSSVPKTRNLRNKVHQVAASFLREDDKLGGVETDANLFHHRFTALFRSAAVTASLNPLDELHSFVAMMEPIRTPIHTYSKREPRTYGNPAKKTTRKPEIPPGLMILSSVTNESVIENIINKKKKFYSLHANKEGPVVKVLVKQIDFPINTSNSPIRKADSPVAAAESPASTPDLPVISFARPICSPNLPASTPSTSSKGLQDDEEA